MEVGLQRWQGTASKFGSSSFQQSASSTKKNQPQCGLDESRLALHQNICSCAGNICSCAGNIRLIGFGTPRHFTYFKSKNDLWLGEETKERRLRVIERSLQRKLRLLVQASIDDEFRSSRNIALSLHQRYKKVVERGFSNNMKDFITAGVNAYAVGCTEEGLRRELLSLRDAGVDLNETSSAGHMISLKSMLTSEEIEECILWLKIVFITILCTPQLTVVRWSSTCPVSAESQLQWRGFCALIANAYYMRGMAWLPVKTLQLEQLAVMGHAEEPSIVADRMRLVFATLENVSPQWPKG